MFSLFLFVGLAFAKDFGQCSDENANGYLQRGYQRQQNNDTLKALEAYKSCLEKQPECNECNYEIGWTFWKLGEWSETIRHWEKALLLNPKDKRIPYYLQQAKLNWEQIRGQNAKSTFRQGTEVLISSFPKIAPIQLNFISRWQSYNPSPENPLDHYDMDVDSPKSVMFSPDGKWTYVNSLEGGKTLVFESEGFAKVRVIHHKFDKKNSSIVDKKAPFDYKFKDKKPFYFVGKPVEGVFTHQGRYLWVTYYRRSFDELGLQPSALAIIETKTNEIVRVMGTGSISKYIEVSPDGKKIAVSNWGDNSIGLYDISSDNFREFKEQKLLTVESRMKLKNLKSNRDKDCGFCVRGLAFSKDSRFLFVTRMKGGGIAAFDLALQPEKYLGTVFGIQPGPRDVHLSQDGKWMYVGCNAGGTIAKIEVQSLVEKLQGKASKSSRAVSAANLRVVSSANLRAMSSANLRFDSTGIEYKKVLVGAGLRSFKLSPDNRYIFAAVNNSSEVVIVKADTLTILGRIPVDSYPVGLSVSPDGTRLWVTSQGKAHRGGNSVSVFIIKDYLKNQITLKENQPTK